MAKKKAGRKKGGRNKGYFFRTGRGWYVVKDRQFVPLTDENGERLRDKETDTEVLREAHARLVLDRPAERHDALLPDIADAQVGAVCASYLDHLRSQAGELTTHPRGKAKTYVDRGQTLFDFCYGLPGEFFCNGDREKRAIKGDPEFKRIHPGFGQKFSCEITPADIDAWLKAHTWKPGGWRTRVQAVKRAFNFGVERKMISASPIRGYRLPKSSARVTYLSPDQEVAMISASSPAFALALKVCIRTGARFGIEFAALCARHVRDEGDRMEWVFKPDESKTGKLRTIRVADPEIIEIVRKQISEHPEGSIFRNQNGEPWNRRMLSQNFRRVKAKVKTQKVLLDRDACMYSCRHTYAKRTLEGFWTGKPASIKTLARLMGNTVQVCIDHYLQFSEADNEMLWGSA